MNRVFRLAVRFVVALALLVAVLLAGGFALTLLGDPTFDAPPATSSAAAVELDRPSPAIRRTLRMRDGTALAVYARPRPGARVTIVLVHGVLGGGRLLERPTELLRAATGAEVLAVDLRGHGASGGARGDVAYVGQYEDDLGDLVGVLRRAEPERRIVLAGHSMGGGIALRYAEKTDPEARPRPLPAVDGYLLFAPYLGWEAPTTRKVPPSEEAARRTAGFIRVHVPRILGLKILNTFGIRVFDGLRVQFFNLPPEVPLRSYSYRATESQAPADYRSALAAVRAPLLLLAGSRDGAFLADRYEDVLRRAGRGRAVIVPDATHDGILVDPRAIGTVREWVSTIDR